ncbi:MAG TPA: PilZ domain-containing protein [Smithella sp.]|mgnify:CR=1 FL=1|nr:PilZ domain-containing protein [Smithella sp.]HRS97350.1 PilZ domain-containing protein [Smithella sp.]
MMMQERRKFQRLNELHQVSVTPLTENAAFSDGLLFYNYSENLSVSGTKIRGNILLPVGALVRIDFTLKNPNKKISVTGRVKWNNVIIANHYCEAGIEFVEIPADTFWALQDYIASRQARKNMDPLKNLFHAFSKKGGSGTEDSGSSGK